jgi:hypothetical protein
MGFEHTAATLFSAFDLGQAGKIFEEEIFGGLKCDRERNSTGSSTHFLSDTQDMKFLDRPLECEALDLLGHLLMFARSFGDMFERSAPAMLYDAV